MRPIDADRLLKTIESLDVECVDQKQASIMLNTIRKVFPKIVNDEPTIQAEPVKHGRWVVSDTQRHVEVTYECSECQHEAVGEYEKTPFCGGCGARMKSDNNG